MAIRRIVVKKLFGHYNYDLGGANSANLAILYGDNGSGKTTILNMVYFLLSHVNARGHKTALAKIKFLKFEVEFYDGIKVKAVRKAPEEGDYEIVICENKKIDKYNITTNPEGAVTQECLGAGKALKRLHKLGVKVHFISDRRDFLSYEKDDNRRRREVEFSGSEFIYHHKKSQIREKISSFDLKIIESIQRAENWVQKTVLYSSGIGQTNSNSVYLKVVQNLCSTFSQDKENVDQTILINKLDKLQKISSDYSKYGMATSDVFNELKTLVLGASQKQLFSIVRVLQPFLDSTEARLEELDSTYTVIKNFSDYLMTFFSSKNVSFDVVNGLSFSIGGEVIEYIHLSSGEKQLLSILCNVLASRDQNSIFIIDEPEISLNVKWQRILINALLDCADKDKTQFLIATHSIEMISQHKDNVLKLDFPNAI